MLPEEAFIPGISRFEQLCRLLINQIKTILSQAYPSGPLTVIIQTSASDKKQEIQYFSLLWEDEKLPWMPDIHALSNSSIFNNWNKFLSTARYPLLVLALHYRQPEEALAEFACALLLLPEAMLKSSEQRDAVRVFRAMPLNTGALPRELAELRDIWSGTAGYLRRPHRRWGGWLMSYLCPCILILQPVALSILRKSAQTTGIWRDG